MAVKTAVSACKHHYSVTADKHVYYSYVPEFMPCLKVYLEK